MLSEEEKQFLNKNRAGIFFAAVFVLFGILFSTLGFFKTMFIVLLAVAGWGLGRVAGDKELIRRFLNNYFGK
jgi:uncharacterized membrane protein